MNHKIALVLEGGGLRGVFTAGVLDYFMDENLYFPYVIGVSMGACNAASYISRQRGRNKKVTINYVRDKRYLSLGSFLKTGNLFGMEFIFNEIPRKLETFDYEQFYKAEQDYIITATSCETGKPVYFNKKDCGDCMDVLRASSSLPFISTIVDYNGQKLLDGGISDSIPVKKALVDGNESLVVITTRHAEYIKSPISFNNKILANITYRKYPELIKSIIKRYEIYNETTAYIKKLEAEGKACVIRPTEPLKVGRIERDKDKLEKLYELGYEIAKRNGDKLKAFIQ